MNAKLKELFNSYALNNNSMKKVDFIKFINDHKIIDEKQGEKIYDVYSINNKLYFVSFKYSLKEIGIRKKISYDNILEEIFSTGEKDDIKKIDEKTKETLEDMCIMGNLMKKEIIKEKKIHPEKFIPIEEAIKEKDNSINFCLGVLAQKLENIGIVTAIEKETNNDEESIKASETVLNFIMNGMIDKNKFDLHFDFGQKRNNELLNNKLEQDKFNQNLKKGLSREYNISEEKIIITNPQKGSYNVQVIFMDEEFNNNMDVSIFQQRCKNSKEFDQLKYLKEIHKTLIMEGCKLNKNMLDPEGNRSSGWPVGECRGGLPYKSPQGWIGFGLKVTGKYDNGNDDWLAADGNKNEWAVAYHGAGTSFEPVLEKAVEKIATGGFKVGEGQKYEDSVNLNNPGTKVGRGIYCSPDPDVMEKYAEFSESKSKIQGNKFIMGFMMRVKPDKIRKPEDKPDYWVLNPTTDEMRPYRILVKEKKNNK